MSEMNPKLKALRERLSALVSELRVMHEAAGDEPLDEAGQTAWDEKVAEREKVQAEHDALEARLAEIERLSQLPGHTLPGDDRGPEAPEVMRRVEPFDGSDVRDLAPAVARDKALKTLDMRGYGDGLEDRQKRHVDKMLRSANKNTDGAWLARLLLATERDEYRSAFQKLTTLGTGAAVLTSEEARAVAAVNEIRAMKIGTDSAGGFGVPVLIDPSIILTGQGSPNDVLRLARIETITNDEWKGVSSAGVTWQFDAEAAEVTDNSPTLAQPTVTARKADAYIPYSIEVGQDYPGFAAEMRALLADGYNELLAHKLTTGVAASNEPVGVATALASSSSAVETTTSAAISAADVYGLWDALPARYRRGVRTAWMSSTSVQNDLRQLGTVDPNFTVNLTAEGIQALFGREYPTNDYMDDVPASGTGAANLLIVGDWVNYLVAQRAGMSVELVQHVLGKTNNRPTGERAWYAWARVGGNVINANGFRMLVNNDGSS